MSELAQPFQHLRVGLEILKKCVEFFPDEDHETLGYVIQTIFLKVLTLEVFYNLAEIFVLINLLSYLHCIFTLLRLCLTLYLLNNQVLILAVLLMVVPPMNQQIRHGLMIRGEDICCNICHILHLEIIALMHGTFQPQTNQPISEAFIPSTVLNKDLHLPLDLTLYILETKDLLQAEIIPR